MQPRTSACAVRHPGALRRFHRKRACRCWGRLVFSAPPMSAHQPDPLRPHSSVLVDGPARAGARSMLRPVGFTEADFKKPIVGIASTWSMVTPCNMHIDALARESEAGTNTAGGKAIIFGTITVSDGISMGTP